MTSWYAYGYILGDQPNSDNPLYWTYQSNL